MSSLFRKLPIMDVFKKVAKMAGIGGSKTSAAPAAPAEKPADKPADKPAAGMQTTAAIEDSRKRSGRRRARRTGGMRLLMSPTNKQGSNDKQSTLGPS